MKLKPSRFVDLPELRIVGWMAVCVVKGYGLDLGPPPSTTRAKRSTVLDWLNVYRFRKFCKVVPVYAAVSRPTKAGKA